MLTGMNPRPIVSRIPAFLLSLSFFILPACGGGGGASPAPAITFLTAGMPMTDTVVLSGFNFYAASVIPGALYKISITNLSDDADLAVYGTDSTFTTPATCSIDNTAIAGFSSEDCIITVGGSTMYFGVDGTFLTTSAGTYTIDIELLPFPTKLNLSLPRSDIIAQIDAGVYSVNVAAGTAYTVSITGLDDDADLYVFGNDATFTTQAKCFPDNTFIAGTTPEDCTVRLISGTTLNFIVDGIFSTATSVDYTVLAASAPAIPEPVTEGTPSVPIVLSALTPTTGQVGFGGTSYYEATNLSPGTYTVSITGLTADVALAVTTPASCLIDNTGFVGLTPEDCALQVSGPTLFFKVTAETLSDGAAYIILVEPGP